MPFYAPYANEIGHVGVFCFLLAYFLLQKAYLGYDSIRYLLLNLAGAILVLISLTIHWNLPAFVLEACWALISMFGIIRSLMRKQKPRDDRPVA